MIRKIFICLLLFSTMLFSSCIEQDNNQDDSKESTEPVDERIIINEVHISLDTKNYTASTEEAHYSIKVSSDTYHNFIFVEFTSTSDYRFSKSTIIYVNSKQVSNNLTYNEDYSIVTYKMADPNWSPIV